MITYIYTGENSQSYLISKDKISKDSLLDIIYRRRSNKAQDIAYSDDPDIIGVLYYLDTKYQTYDEDMTAILDYWGVRQTYDHIWNSELEMENTIHLPEYKDQPVMTNQYYKLIPMSTFHDNYNFLSSSYKKPDDLLFPSDLYKQVPDYNTDKQRLGRLDFLLTLAQQHDVSICFAGEYVFRVLLGVVDDFDVLLKQLNIPSGIDYFGQEIYRNKIREVDQSRYEEGLNSDIVQSSGIYATLTSGREPTVDVCFYGNNDPINIVAFINSVGDYIQEMAKLDYPDSPNKQIVIRTNNCINLISLYQMTRVLSVNFVMIGYSTFSEALHGFDIDCLCLGWDGQDVYATERGNYALFGGFNTINLDIASDSYEELLAKYGVMGISVFVPELDDYNVKRNLYPVTSTQTEQLYSPTLTQLTQLLPMPLMSTQTIPNIETGSVIPKGLNLLLDREKEYLDNEIDYIIATTTSGMDS